MKRNTIQHTLVLETVRRLKNHPTADDVYEEIAVRHPNISKATVYRNLNKLAEEGLIRKRSIHGEADRFDHKCGDHYHIKCERCGQVFDVDMEYIPDLPSRIRDTHGFTVTTHDIFFSGICPACQEKAKTEENAAAEADVNKNQEEKI